MLKALSESIKKVTLNICGLIKLRNGLARPVNCLKQRIMLAVFKIVFGIVLKENCIKY